MNEKRILEIRVAPDATITKGMTYRGRPGFILPITYVIEGGLEQPSRISEERKKDILPCLERERASAANGAMKAQFNDAGEWWGTVTRYEFGLGGMRPIPSAAAMLAG